MTKSTTYLHGHEHNLKIYCCSIAENNPTQRICRFHDRVMELHESKVDQVHEPCKSRYLVISPIPMIEKRL